MSFPKSPPFNPTISKVPILGPSSGDPAAKNDPKSVASIGGNIQAMQDQANADRLYDAPVKQVEGYDNYSHAPWIVNSQACKRIQGFTDMPKRTTRQPAIVMGLLSLSAVLVLISFLRKE